MLRFRWCAELAAAILIAAGLAGCGGTPSSPQDGKTVIRVEGSDTMLVLAQAWANQYCKTHPNVRVQVSGGGTRVGIASLIEGATDLVDASRRMTDEEKKRTKDNTGQDPVEWIVAQDGITVYVHKKNPLDVISIEELAEIYGENGTISEWKQLGVKNVACQNDKIVRISRLNNSGTYRYFHEAILGRAREYKLGSIDLIGSKEVVEMVANTPCAIGYSGMEYATEEVKALKIAKAKGDSGVEPTVKTVKSGEYPLSRHLFMYTLGQPTGAIKEYMDWIMSEKGQKIALDLE